MKRTKHLTYETAIHRYIKSRKTKLTTDENKRLNIKYVIQNFVCKASHTKKITSFNSLVDGRLFLFHI
jgi:hypothetical protein